ncbi:class II aldolase/adducin family protein [Oceanibacterium hippocampi]|uniref:Decarboxylase NovR n=1 Tax=Oceanibacterium hippocampi TaxID=745714 RepID=A0A1Y5TT82_9PROT|nr:class II aldolase/adducin family protein [Oceanibacterium hippocampi]SLN70987.1 Decarboxylase NovR [Oceanibacterium hippocampi]
MTTDILADLAAERPDDYTAEEWKLRVELAACYRVFDILGWTELLFNHITLRVPGETPAYLINPFGLNYNEVTARNLIRIGLDGTPLEKTEHHVNRAGFVIHSAIHAARADAHCIAHTHTTDGMAVACKEEGLRYDDFYGAELWGDVAYHDFEGITVHEDEGPRLVRSLSDKHIMILRNHGMLVVGGDVFSTFRWAWTLERACNVQCAAGALPGPDRSLSDEIRAACARDARAFEPKGLLERMLFLGVLRRAAFDPGELLKT